MKVQYRKSDRPAGSEPARDACAPCATISNSDLHRAREFSHSRVSQCQYFSSVDLGCGGGSPVIACLQLCQTLFWQDFVQEMPDSVLQAADPATAWLRSYLSHVNDSSGEEVNTLSRLYRNVKTLFLPATTKSDLQDLSQLEWKKLTTEFKQELGDLKKHILGSLHARSFEGAPMTGRTLERSLRFIVQGLQRGKFHDLPSIWVTWTQQVAEMSLQDADVWFHSLLSNIDHDEEPLPLRDFNNKVEDARTKSVQFYMELLRDFDVRPDIPELRKRMGVHFQSKLGFYHGRVQQWLGDLIAREKEGFSKLLSHRELPFDPDLFRKKGEDAIRKLVDDFNAKLQAFASRGKDPVHGKPAPEFYE
eukprot:symbB.v1.2.018073.t1/scaffold1429.1/size119369/1